MKVITGLAKGRNLLTPPGTETRPTSQMAKEAMFSAIQFEIEGAAVLDLFAGSGQMGIEALSRGARSCVFVDHARASVRAIQQNLAHTGFADAARVHAADAASFLAGSALRFDIAFLDPPYQKGLLTGVLPRVAALMNESGVILCECERSEELPETAGGFVLTRKYRYGKAQVAMYRTLAE